MKLYRIFTTILVASLFALHVQGQMNATLYHMKDTPFNNQLNPSFQPTYGSVFVGFGPLSSLAINANVYGKGMNYDNMMGNRNLENIAANIKDYAALGVGLDMNLINVGILVDDWYFTFDTKVRMDAEGGLNGDIPRLLWYGNAHEKTLGKTMQLGNTGVAATVYAEASMGVSKQIIPKILTVGGKAKYLQGGAYGEGGLTNNSTFHTDPDNYKLTVVVDPYIKTGNIPFGLKSGTNISFNDVTDAFEMDDYEYQPTNHGFAFDLGANWQVLDKLHVSGSILDLGFIRWKDIVTVEATKPGGHKVEFEGVDIQDQEALKKLEVKIIDSMMVNVSRRAASVEMISPKFYLGANYELNKYLNAGALLGLEMGRFDQKTLAALSINTQGFMVNTSLSFSYFNGMGNMGFGLLIGRRIVQAHLIVDNLLGAINYGKMQNMTLRFGGNLLFGHGLKNRPEKKLRNNALVESSSAGILVID